jgi:hypothetical protein
MLQETLDVQAEREHESAHALLDKGRKGNVVYEAAFILEPLALRPEKRQIEYLPWSEPEDLFIRQSCVVRVGTGVLARAKADAVSEEPTTTKARSPARAACASLSLASLILLLAILCLKWAGGDAMAVSAVVQYVTFCAFIEFGLVWLLIRRQPPRK